MNVNNILHSFIGIINRKKKKSYDSNVVVGMPQNKSKKKIKKGAPMLTKLFAGKEQMVTAGVMLVVLLLLLFLYDLFGTWDYAKKEIGVDQFLDIELPGKNNFDKK